MAELTLMQLQRQFGAVDSELDRRIRALTLERLRLLGVALLEFKEPKDLEAWIGQQSD